MNMSFSDKELVSKICVFSFLGKVRKVSLKVGHLMRKQIPFSLY